MKYAIALLVAGSIAVLFSLALLILTIVKSDITLTDVLICLSGVSLSMIVAFYALFKINQNGHLVTDFSILLRK